MNKDFRTMLVALLSIILWSGMADVANAQKKDATQKSLVTKEMAHKVANSFLYDKRPSYGRTLFYQANNISRMVDGDRIFSDIENHLDCVEKFIIEILRAYGTDDGGYLALQTYYFTPDEYDIAVKIYNNYKGTTKEPRKVEDKPQQKVKSEPMPSSAGGTLDTGGEIKKWIDKNTKYPEDAQNNGEQGRVVVKFHIDTDGTISNVNIVRGVCPSIDKEAMRVVSSIPKKLIVKQNKDIVKGEYRITLPFYLFP